MDLRLKERGESCFLRAKMIGGKKDTSASQRRWDLECLLLFKFNVFKGRVIVKRIMDELAL